MSEKLEKPPTLEESTRSVQEAKKTSYFILSENGLRNKDRDEATGRNIYWTADPNVELPIQMNQEGPASIPPSTVPRVFKANALSEPERLALQVERDGKEIEWSWGRYYKEARSFAKATIALGMRERGAANIIGWNAPEWFIAFTGTILANLIPAGVYTTNSPEACLYVAENSEAQIIVVENQTQLQKYEGVLEKLDQVKAFVVYADDLP